MADRGRGTARGNPRGGAGPGGGGSFRGGGGRHGGPQGSLPTMDKPKREAILDLSKYVNERIRVKFTGGREGTLAPCVVLCCWANRVASRAVNGILKGYDQLLNLVLDEVEEQLLEPEPHTRSLGLTVLRGPTITLLSPVDGSEEIANPFLGQE
ncbi:U6 snRNA-associated Sm-like protein LSm7 [Mycena venus]|uniref:U6 snRNA-associated Sm-like protein LSm7 n=1 Tax=Mycena venus TaxID=2733690 RepID=A0A8H6U053_9AGAR|nr:U6 snRNA-associated Sm-like protein LSm7 [Mycena venus]